MTDLKPETGPETDPAGELPVNSIALLWYMAMRANYVGNWDFEGKVR